MQVDDSQGYLIDRFAVEDLWCQPHYPVTASKTDEYLAAEAAAAWFRLHAIHKQNFDGR